MSVYSDLFEARYNEVKHDYHTSKEARRNPRPGALRKRRRRITTR